MDLRHSCKCLHCNTVISLDDVNVASDLALCRHCGRTMKFSEIAPMAGAAEVDELHPPKGVRLEESVIHGQTIIYKKISPVVYFLIPFTAVWSGMSMFGIYGTQIAKGRFDLYSSLFGLPFLLGTIVLVSIILFNLFGRWQISFSGGTLAVALRLGPLAWTRRHPYDQSTRVRIHHSPDVTVNNRPQQLIFVETQGRTLKFGSTIPEAAKIFIAELIRWAERRSLQTTTRDTPASTLRFRPTQTAHPPLLLKAEQKTSWTPSPAVSQISTEVSRRF